MQEIVKGVVEISLRSADAAGWTACGTLRGGSPGRRRWERGRTSALSASGWGGARVAVQSRSGFRAPPRLGRFHLPQSIQQVGRHRSIGTGLHQGAEEILRVLLDLHPVAGGGVALSAGRGWCRACGARGERQFLGEAAAEGLQAFTAAGVEAHGRRGAGGWGREGGGSGSGAAEGVTGGAAAAGIGAAGHGAKALEGIAAQGHVGEVGAVDAHVQEAGVEGEGIIEAGVA